MQKVLDQHAALGPKPLETLTAQEARKAKDAVQFAAMGLKREFAAKR